MLCKVFLVSWTIRSGEALPRDTLKAYPSEVEFQFLQASVPLVLFPYPSAIFSHGKCHEENISKT